MINITRREAIVSAGAAAVLGLFPAPAVAKASRPAIGARTKGPSWDRHPQVSLVEAMRIAKELAHRPSPEKLALMLQHDQCIDDRSLPKVGFLNYPGAHPGLYACAAQFANHFTNGVVGTCEAVEEVVGGREHIRFHANGPNDRLRGCKHCEGLFDNPTDYVGVTPEHSRFIAERVEGLPVEPDVLLHEHTAHIGFIVTRDGPSAPDGRDAWAFDTVTQHCGKDLHAFVYKPTRVGQLRLRPLARALRARSAQLAALMVEDEVFDQLAMTLDAHFLTTVRAIAPDTQVQWFKVKIGSAGVLDVKPFRTSPT